MPRDLLAALQLKMQNENGEDQVDRKNGKYDVLEMEVLSPEQPFNEFEEIWIMLRGFKTKTEMIKLEQEKIINTPNPSDQTKKDLELLEGDIKRRIKDIRDRLKSIDKGINEYSYKTRKSNDSSITTKIRIQKTQFAALSTTFKNSIEEYHTIEVNYSEQRKGRLKRQLAISADGADVTDEKVEEMINKGDWTIFGQNIINDTEQARHIFEAVKSRHNELLQIEKSITEINELFLEVAQLVAEQAPLIDRIEDQVDASRNVMEKTVQELKEAEDKKRAARKRKICIYVTVTVIILIIFLVLVISFSM